MQWITIQKTAHAKFYINAKYLKRKIMKCIENLEIEMMKIKAHSEKALKKK